MHLFRALTASGFAVTAASAAQPAPLDPSCDGPYVPAYTIQGSGPRAALTGRVTSQGVVVGDFEGGSGLRGFYLQDASGDSDPATSDGIFVFTGRADSVSAGQRVRVTGYARERFGQTTLEGSNSDSSAVPAADIVDCGAGSVTATDVMLPFASTEGPERYEGMLVRLPQALVISDSFDYGRFGELVLALPLPGESRAFAPTSIVEPGAPALARALANRASRITLDDALGARNPRSLRHPNGATFSLDNRFRVGDTVQNTVGVLGYDFGRYRIQPTAPADYAAVDARPTEPETTLGDVRVVWMNAHNFFLTPDHPTGHPLDNQCGPARSLECRGADSDQPLELGRQRDKLLAALAGLNADVIGLGELENTPGVDPLDDPTNGIVPGLAALRGSGSYASIDTGTIGTDAIRVGLLYRPDVVTPAGSFELLTTADDPRFIDRLNRPALAQTFDVVGTGARFTVVVNHWKSKGSGCSSVGDPDTGDGQGHCNGTRTAAARALVDWLASDPTGSGDEDFLIIGDLNSYAQEDPIDAVRAGPDDSAGTSDDYTNLISETYAYSYVFDGELGTLDHALASSHLAPVADATHWHINAAEPELLDYDTSFKPAAQEALYEPNAYRSSDHDAVLVGLDLCDDVAPTLQVSVTPNLLWPPRHRYVNVEATVALRDDSDPSPTLTLLSVTSNEPDDGTGDGNTVNDIVIVDQTSFELRAERNGNGSGRVYTIIYQATDACGNSTIESATVSVPARTRARRRARRHATRRPHRLCRAHALAGSSRERADLRAPRREVRGAAAGPREAAGSARSLARREGFEPPTLRFEA